MDMSSTAKVHAFTHRWWDAKDLPPSLRRGTKKLIERLKEKDFTETVKVGGKDWDLYQSLSSSKMFFLALRITEGQAVEVIVSDSQTSLKKALEDVSQ